MLLYQFTIHWLVKKKIYRADKNLICGKVQEGSLSLEIEWKLPITVLLKIFCLIAHDLVTLSYAHLSVLHYPHFSISYVCGSKLAPRLQFLTL